MIKPLTHLCPIKGTLANSVEPDQTPHYAASDLDLQSWFALNTGVSLKYGINKNKPKKKKKKKKKKKQTPILLEMYLSKDLR